MGLSEHRVPTNPMVNEHLPLVYPFSDKPKYHIKLVLSPYPMYPYIYIYIIIYPIIVNLNKFSQNSLVKSLSFLDKSQICWINAFFLPWVPLPLSIQSLIYMCFPHLLSIAIQLEQANVNPD